LARAYLASDLARCSFSFVSSHIYRVLLALLTAASWAPFARAQDSLLAEIQRDRANLAHELTTCAAYYQFISHLPGLTEEAKQGLRANSDELGTYAINLSDGELYAARFKLAVETMGREMSDTWDRVSIINAKYGYPCRDLLGAVRAVWPSKREEG
jgi:hypothetical protein